MKVDRNVHSNENELNRLLRISPITQKEDLDRYIEVLDRITRDNNLNIIALIGDYGSGKSSLIRSYLEHCNANKFLKEKYLFLSALPFKKNEIDKVSNQGRDVLIDKKLVENGSTSVPDYYGSSDKIERASDFDENDLSKKIVEQIYNQCLNKNAQKMQYRLYPYFLFFWVLIVMLRVLNDLLLLYGSTLFLVQILTFNIPTDFVQFLTLFIIIYSIVNYLSDHSSFSLINAVKLSSLEIELKNANIDLGKVSTQLISLIKRTTFTKVIIEDLDRFDDFEVVYQLREFAYLYNNSVSNKCRKQFFFLLDDKNLTEEIRAKFFDYSLNVVPYYSKFNSFDFLQRVKKVCNNTQDSISFISNDFLKLIAKHIDDSRVIRSILIDYLFLSKNYFKSIGEKIESRKDLDSKKSRERFEESLLAATIYRHLFKDDYNCMLKHSGELYGILIASPSKRTEELKKSLEELETKITKAEKEFLDNLQELRIVSAIKQSYPTIFKDNRKSFSLNANISYDENNGIYKDRYLVLERGKRDYINELLVKKEELRNRISYYVPKNDDELKFSLSSKTNEKYFELITQMLIRGYLNQTIRTFTNYNLSQLLEEEQDLLHLLLDGENNVNPAIKIDNCELMLTQIESDIFELTKYFNYDLINFSRDNIRFQSHYVTQIKNIESKAKSSDMKITTLRNLYGGMIRHDNKLYDLLLKDIELYSISFIDSLFDVVTQNEDIDFLYQLLTILLISTGEKNSWINNNRESNDNIRMFFSEHFDINTFFIIYDKGEKETDLFEILKQIRDYITQSSTHIYIEKYLLIADNNYSNKVKDYLIETVVEKIKLNEFVVNGYAIKYLFYSPLFDLYSLNIEKVIEYLVSENELTIEALDLSVKPFSLSARPLIGLSERLFNLNFINILVNNSSVEVVESLLLKMSLIREFEENIIDGKLELGDYSIVTTPFIDLEAIENNDTILKIIDNCLFYKNEDNINFLVKNSRSPKYKMSILSYFHVTKFIDVSKYKDVFTKELIIEIFKDLVREKSINKAWISDFVKNVLGFDVKISCVGIDPIAFLLLLEFDLLVKDNDFYHFILLKVRNERYITMYFDSIVSHILTNKDSEALFIQFVELGYCKIETVLNLMKHTGLFKKDVFSKIEIKFRTVRISKNSTRISFKLEELNKEDAKIIGLLERLGFIRKLSLVKGKVTFKIDWDKDIE